MTNILLFFIITLGSVLRLFRLGSLPISLFGDEIDVGYHAWSLISTGKDYMGHLLPTYIQSLSESRAPLLMYLTAPFVGIFGHNSFGIRLPVAIFGIAGIYLIFLVANKLFSTYFSKVGLFAAFTLAVTPWHIHYSRAAFEVVPLIFFLLLGTYLFLEKKIYFSLIPFALTLYLYSTATIFTPLFVLTLFLIYRPRLDLHKHFYLLIPSVIIVIPIIANILFGSAAGRFNLISVFSDHKITESIILARTDPWIKPSPDEIVFHNKPLAYLSVIARNYTQAFSSEFLFLNGDPDFRHSIGGYGELLYISLPFMLAGLYFSIKNLRSTQSLLIFSWLLLSPLSSSLTQGGGQHATRLFLMIPPLVLLTALGLAEFINLFAKPIRALAGIFIVILFFLFIVPYWHRYSVHYRYESARHWQNGYSEIFSKLAKHLPANGKVYINNTYEPGLLRFALFTNYPPKEFITSFVTDNPDSYKTDYFSGFKFGENYYFGQVDVFSNLPLLLQSGDLYVAAQGKEVPGNWDWRDTPPAGLKVLESVVDMFGAPQFYIISKTD